MTMLALGQYLKRGIGVLALLVLPFTVVTPSGGQNHAAIGGVVVVNDACAQVGMQDKCLRAQYDYCNYLGVTYYDWKERFLPGDN